MPLFSERNDGLIRDWSWCDGCAFYLMKVFHLVEIFSINERKLKRSILNRLKYKKITLCYSSPLKHTYFNIPKNITSYTFVLCFQNRRKASVYGIRLSHIFEIPSISNEKPRISFSIKNLGFRSKY